MQTASVSSGTWPGIVSQLSSLIDLETSARETGALIRRRRVRSAADLLHLALLYGPGGMSLRSVASHATETGLANLCDVSLLGRLRKATNYLEDVLQHLLARRLGTGASGWADAAQRRRWFDGIGAWQPRQ